MPPLLRDSDLPALGRRIRERRAVARMKQAALADAIGVTQAQISRLETGSCSLSVIQVEKIAQVFGVSAAALMQGQ